MSTNSTNTNNGSGRPKPDAPGSNHRPGAGAHALRFPFAAFPVPDPETLDRLANEFFLVISKDLENGNHELAHEFPADADSEVIPTTRLTEDMLPLHGSYTGEPASDVTEPHAPSPPGPLTENDLRAIAASLGDATSLASTPPSTVPAPSSAGTAEPLTGTQISPFGIAPNLPPGNDLFSFTGISQFPTAPSTSTPSGADVASVAQSPSKTPAAPPGATRYFAESERNGVPAEAQLPPVNDLFSFPRVPAIPNTTGLQTVAPQLGPPASAPPMPTAGSPEAQRTLASAPTVNPPAGHPASYSPAKSHEERGPTPKVPFDAGYSNADISARPDRSLAAETDKPVYPGVTAPLSSFDLSVFPSVPGVQSPPGVPVLPTSVPKQPAAQETPSAVNAVLPPVTPASSAPISETKSLPRTSAATTPPSSTSRFEFLPNVVPDLGVTKRPLDPRILRRDFPILEERIHGRQLVWLDNAATTQKPNAVIDRIAYFYRHENSNIHRAAHTLAARATDAYESAREKTRRFLNASTTKEIIFVRGTTEGINLIAQSWGRRHVQKDDEIVITWLEHHANIVPWQQLCAEKGARLRVAPVNDRGEVILEEYEKLLGPRTRIVSFSQVSNALGTVTPAREMVEMAHGYGARVVVDGAQAVSHMRVDVQALDCDFYVFSGHKVFGPTGIGAVYGKLDVLEKMPPWQGGGNMIVDVTFEETVYQGAPARFEAGTGNIADAVGLGAALDYVEQIGMENISAYEHDLLIYGTAKLLTVPGLRLIGTARDKAGVLSFVLDEVRTEDVGAALNEEGIAVRSGHHCAQPILRRMGVESTVRPSLAFYNTCEELDQLTAALLRLQAGRSQRRLSNER